MAFFDTLLDLLAMADLIMLYKKKASRQSVRQFLVQRRASTPHFRRFTASLAYRRARGSPYDPSRPEGPNEASSSYEVKLTRHGSAQTGSIVRPWRPP